MELKRVVVTGLGAITPVGNTVPQMWSNIVAGVSGAGPVTHFNAELFKTRFACEVKNFDAAEYIDKKEARKMDLDTQYGIAAAVQAVKDASLDLEAEDKDRIGVVYGVGIGGIRAFEEEYANYVRSQERGPRLSPFLITKMISDIVPGHISILFGLRGPNYTTTAACASSTNAIIDACHLIRLGKANVMLAGGAEGAVSVTGIAGFNAMHALSTRNDDAEHASRPFSASRDGFVMGEGAGCLVLEELEHARARGARIYAELVGTGLSADAYHITSPDPDGSGAALVMRNALDDAQIAPDAVDYINVHGTSTPVGDISECKAIKTVFGPAAYQVSISSTKSMTGHLLGAAGAVEGVISVLSVYHDTVPPTINHTPGDDDPQLDYAMNFTFGKAQQRTVRYAMSNTFGFGGHNSCVVFKKYTDEAASCPR